MTIAGTIERRHTFGYWKLRSDTDLELKVEAEALVGVLGLEYELPLDTIKRFLAEEVLGVTDLKSLMRKINSRSSLSAFEANVFPKFYAYVLLILPRVESSVESSDRFDPCLEGGLLPVLLAGLLLFLEPGRLPPESPKKSVKMLTENEYR